MNNITEELNKAKELLTQGMQALNTVLEKIEGKNERQLEEWLKPRTELWSKIYLEGGIITREKLHEIWTKMGFSAQGLGGFFCGRKPSLIQTSGNKIALSQDAEEYIKDWTGQPIEEYSKRFKD